MSHPRTYQPELPKALIKALYHEAKHRHLPMTKLLAEIVTHALDNTEGMCRAREELGTADPHKSAA